MKQGDKLVKWWNMKRCGQMVMVGTREVKPTLEYIVHLKDWVRSARN